MPDTLFLDRDGDEIGVIQTESTNWRVGAVLERESGLWRIVDVIVPSLQDDAGIVAYVIVERVA